MLNHDLIINDENGDEDQNYTIELLEHFEDWYVGECIEFDESFDSFIEAIEVFKKNCDRLIHNDISTMYLEKYIDDNVIEDMEENLSQWSMGYVLRLNYNEDTIISIHFDYDYEKKIIEKCSIIEYDKDKFKNFDLSDIFSSLKLEIDFSGYQESKV
jgi:NOL1/NOP2/fmu family ribosome biogenesis protein